MNNIVRENLKDIVKQHGKTLCFDKKLCKAYLNDYCSSYKKEISALLGVVEVGGLNILTSSNNEHPTVLLNRIVTLVCKDTAMSEQAAKWAVNSWAVVLGIISESDAIDSPVKEKVSYINNNYTNAAKANSADTNTNQQAKVNPADANINQQAKVNPANTNTYQGSKVNNTSGNFSNTQTSNSMYVKKDSSPYSNTENKTKEVSFKGVAVVLSLFIADLAITSVLFRILKSTGNSSLLAVPGIVFFIGLFSIKKYTERYY